MATGLLVPFLRGVLFLILLSDEKMILLRGYHRGFSSDCEKEFQMQIVRKRMGLSGILGISLVMLVFSVQVANASPGSSNAFGVGVEVEGADPVSTPGSNGDLYYGGGVDLQYWFTKDVGVRAGLDYLNQSKTSAVLPTNILPFYSGLLINLFSTSYMSFDLEGDFGQALLAGNANTYFDAGAMINGPLSSARQFFLDVRFREVGVGTMAQPWEFVTAGIGVNFY